MVKVRSPWLSVLLQGCTKQLQTPSFQGDSLLFNQSKIESLPFSRPCRNFYMIPWAGLPHCLYALLMLAYKLPLHPSLYSHLTTEGNSVESVTLLESQTFCFPSGPSHQSTSIATMPPIASVGNGNESQADATILDDCARDSLEHDNPANMAHPPNANSSLLEALPDELLMETFEHLVCDKTSSTDEPAYDTITFRSLCLVSKRIDLIARPYLFKKIYVVSPDRLIKLYRALAGNEQLGRQIKKLDLDVDLEIIAIEAAERQELRDGRHYQTVQSFLDKSPSTIKECDEIAILCYKLLSQTVNLASLEMSINPEEHMGSHSDTGDVEFRGLSPHRCYSAFFNLVSSASRSTASRGDAVFLPQLKTLTMWCPSGLPSVENLEPFLDLPSLRTVRSIGDDGNWCHLTPRAELYEPEAHLHSEWDPCSVSLAYAVMKSFTFIFFVIQ